MQRPVTIALERVDPRKPEIAVMIRELDRYMGGLYPAESNHLVDIETLAQPNVRFFAALVDGEYCGCGAIMIRAGEYAEVKRIFVSPRARNLGLGRKILATLIEAGRAEKLPALMLETGTLQPEALGLFEAMGFARCGPFGDYPTDDPYSVFMEMRI